MPKPSDQVTKQDINLLKRELRLLRDELKQDVRKALDLTEARFSKKFDSYRDDVLTKFDAVMKELETMREESTIGTYQTRELEVKVNNHEKRISTLESA